MTDDQTHYVGDSCPGGHADDAALLGVCVCGRPTPCLHCPDPTYD